MKKRIMTLTLAVLMLIPNIPAYAAGGVIGESGAIENNGEVGKNGGVNAYPSFRVGLINEEFSTPLNLEDESPNIRKSIRNNFLNHYPKIDIERSVLFSPKENFKTGKQASYGEYDPSTGNILFTPSNLMLSTRGLDMSKLHRVIGDKIRSDNIYYQALYDKVNLDRDRDISKTLGQGKWKDIGIPVPNEAESYKVWNYILANWDASGGDSTEKRLKDYSHVSEDEDYEDANEIKTAEMEFENKIGYLDLLMTLYSLMPEGKCRDFYDAEIERYIKQGEMSTRPPLIGITVDARLYMATEPSRVFVPATDYIEYITSATPGNELTNPRLDTTYGWDFGNFDGLLASRPNHKTLKDRYLEAMIYSSLYKSMQIPNRDRLTDYPGSTPDSGNAFLYGQAGVTGFEIHTRPDEGVKMYITPISKIDGIMSSLWLTEGYPGLMIVENVHTLTPNPQSGGYSLKANEPNPEILDEGSTVLGKVVQLSVLGNFQREESEKLEERITLKTFEPGYPQIKIKLTSDIDTTTYPINITANDAYQPISPDNLLGFIDGTYQFDYIHNTMSYQVETDHSYTFNYDSEITVKLGSKPDDEFQLVGSPATASKTFYNPKADDAKLYGKYTSEATYYSELKEGTPNHEEFEAMAGVPTTRNLYFATGGSEFIAEITTKYYKDLESSRTYKSYFTAVDSEFKAGDTAPTVSVGGFSINAHTGGSQTKTWSGSIPNNASAVTSSGSGRVSASCPAQPDYSAYNADLVAAQAYASQVNGTVISHTAASDGKTRTWNSWGASASPSTNPPKTTSVSQTFGHYEYKTDEDGKTTSTWVNDSGSVTANPSPAGSYIIKVVVTLPAHVICGPECSNVLPEVADTWTQKITYDTQKIESVNIYKIDSASLNGMTLITGTDEITAKVIQGDPNIFYNIAKTETAKDGRVYYSLEPEMLDTVEWNEGPRSNRSNGLGNNGVSNFGLNNDS